MTNKKFSDTHILETTLRDGSYAVNFTFTAHDTAVIVKALEDAGFHYIEIGHGVGMGGSAKGYGKAVETDKGYMKAAQGALKKAIYGMFCIPGIASLGDVAQAHDHGMGFIRVGTNVNQVKSSKGFIKKAKRAGMLVAANYMKSYALKPEEFAKNVLLSEDYGADMVYIVDSAGSMFPEDVRQYYEAVRKVSKIAIGFHGHNNLGMAIANSLQAVELGASFVDSSLQGLGRGGGNASTEMLVAALMKKGIGLGIDFLKILDIGQKFIQPMITTKGTMPLDVVCGYAQFHSSYMHYIQKYSSLYNVDPALLIMEWCKVDRISVDEKKLESLARHLKEKKELYLGRYCFNRYVGREQDAPG